MFICISSVSWCEPTAWPHIWLQLYRVPFPAHGRAGSSWWHALRTFRHIPPQPFLTPHHFTPQLPVALGVRRLGTKSQPARGAVFQRLHALLRESPKNEPGSVLGGVTGSLPPHGLTDFCLSSPTVTAVCGSYSAVSNGWIMTLWQWDQRKPSQSYCKDKSASRITATCWRLLNDEIW